MEHEALGNKSRSYTWLAALFAAVIGLGLAACGDGEPDTKPDGNGATDRQPDAPATPPDGQGQPDQPDGERPDATTDRNGEGNGDGDSEAEAGDEADRPTLTGAALERRIAAEREAVLRLEREGKVAEALRAAQSLERKYPEHRQSMKLTFLTRQMRQLRGAASPLLFRVDQLSGLSTAQLDAAYEQFRRAGEPGALVLGRAVAEQSDAGAKPALSMMAQMGAFNLADACARRLANKPDTALRGRCIELMETRVAQLSPLGMEALYRAAVAQKDRPDGRRLRALAAQRLAKGVDAEAARSLMLLAADADNEADRAGRLRLLAAVYHFAAEREDAAFAEMTGEAADLDRLRDAASAVGGAAETMLQPLDLASLDEGMVTRWTFGTDKWPVLPADIGQAFEGDAVAVERARATELVAASYSVAAWVRPASLPTGEADAPFSVVARKAGWPMAVMVDPAGTVVFMHAVGTEGQLVVTRSKTALEPGAWRHVAAVLDREAGRMALYVDGELEAEASFEGGAAVATDGDPTRPYRALGIDPGEAGQTRFDGDVEALRLYEVGLDAARVGDLTRVGHAWD